MREIKILRFIALIATILAILLPLPVLAAESGETAINGADTVWVLISAALVMLMTPAVGLFYGGMVRKKMSFRLSRKASLFLHLSASSGYYGDTVLHLARTPEDTVLSAVSYTHLRAHETRHDLVCR